MAPQIDHVIVLMLENRSFDHMLGYLPHPNPDFDGVLQVGTFYSDGWDGGDPVSVSQDAKYVLPVDPDHSHDAVMLQLGASGTGASTTLTNRGFVDSYERKGRGLAAPQFGGLLAPVVGSIVAPKPAGPGIEGRGPLIMRCQPPEQVPVLSTLALQFGVCVRWFCSVPGETWPNRNFVHSATSDGTTNITTRFYENKTIFELLEEAGHSWRIYYDDTPQVWAFKALWDANERGGNWYRFGDFASHVQASDLPHYTFIEPNHRPPVHMATPDESTSQHPGNNMIANDQYDAYTPGECDFKRAESLIARIYETLRANPALFERTVMVVTYDEHGGFYDHVPPPIDVPPPGAPNDPGVVGKLENQLFRRKAEAFDFTMLGPRVPALVISPFIPAGTVDRTVRDHASVPSTLRALFAPDAEPLTNRDRWSPPFHTLLTLDTARTDLPDLSAYLAAGTITGEPPLPAGPEPPVPTYFHDLLDLAKMVDQQLPGANTVANGPRDMVNKVTDAFSRFARGK